MNIKETIISSREITNAVTKVTFALVKDQKEVDEN